LSGCSNCDSPVSAIDKLGIESDLQLFDRITKRGLGYMHGFRGAAKMLSIRKRYKVLELFCAWKVHHLKNRIKYPN
jgi:hypothetical protein